MNKTSCKTCGAIYNETYSGCPHCMNNEPFVDRGVEDAYVWCDKLKLHTVEDCKQHLRKSYKSLGHTKKGIATKTFNKHSLFEQSQEMLRRHRAKEIYLSEYVHLHHLERVRSMTEDDQEEDLECPL
jgi:hypothetical protein